MKIVEEGDKVSLKVDVKLESGESCYPDNKDSTIELVVGEGKFFPAVETGLIKMKAGQTKELVLEPDDAFGPHHDELMLDAPRSAFHSDADLSVGMRLKIDTPSGKVFYGTVTDISNETITLDLNHPLAGKKIVFVVTIVDIEKKEK